MVDFEPPTEGDAAQSLRIIIEFLLENRFPPAWAIEDVAQALGRYDAAAVETVGEAFGFPWNKHLASKRAALLAPRIAAMVDHLQAESKKAGKKIPLRGSAAADGAYDIVGRKLNMGPDAVKKYRDAWIRYCKELGVDRSSGESPFADPLPIIARAIMEGLQNSKKK